MVATIDLVALGADPSGVKDSTAAFKTAKQRAAALVLQQGAVDYVYPADSDFLVSFGVPGITTFRIGADLTSATHCPPARFVLAPDQIPLPPKADGTRDDRSTIVLAKNLHAVGIEIDGQAAKQNKRLPDGIRGLVNHGLRLQGDTDADIDATITNCRGETSAGPGETFHFQSLGGDGGRYAVKCFGGAIDQLTGKPITATGAVVQNRKTAAKPWLIHDSIVCNMGIGQAFGTFQGGTGTVVDSSAYNCHGSAMNIESGAGGTPRIDVHRFHGETCGRGLVVNGNYGSKVGRVIVSGSEFRAMPRAVWLVGAPASSVEIDTTFLEATYAAIDFGPKLYSAQMVTILHLLSDTYRLIGGALLARSGKLTAAQLAQLTSI